MFTSDEKGIVEPNSDLIAMALAVIGCIIFIALVSHIYDIYQEKTDIVQHYDDACGLAKLLKTDPVFTITDRPDLIDISRLESLSPEEIGNLTSRYNRSFDFVFKFEALPYYSKVIGTAKDEGICASVPVTIKLNDVREVPGILTVKIWEK